MQTRTAFSLARTCSERCPVFVWDEDSRRCQQLVSALGTVECISAQAHSVPLHEPEEGGAAGAVVALLSSGIAPRDISLIHELKSRFAFVICCIGAAGDADLGGICRLFLAGASHVLDSSRDDFLGLTVIATYADSDRSGLEIKRIAPDFVPCCVTPSREIVTSSRFSYMT